MSYYETSKYGNLLHSGIKCCRNGRWKPSIQYFEMDILLETAKNKRRLKRRRPNLYKTNNFWIEERGKKREIKAHHVRDRQILKSFCKYELEPSVEAMILPSNAASQEGKGTEACIKRFRQDLARAYRKYGRNFYVTTTDFHSYFDTERHSLIMKQLPLSDDDSYMLMRKYLKCFPGNVGVGIGGEPSQDISVVFASSIDRMLQNDPRVDANARYMDDMYFITKTIKDARAVLKKVRKQAEKLSLILNERMTRSFNMRTDTVTWLKKRTYLTKTGKIVMRLTRKNVYEQIKRIDYCKKMIDEGRMPRYIIDISMCCWCSYARPYNSRKAMLKVVRYYMDVFDVPWSRARILFRRHPKGFVKYPGPVLSRTFLNTHRENVLVDILGGITYERNGFDGRIHRFERTCLSP